MRKVTVADLFCGAAGERFYTYVDPAQVKPTIVRGLPVWGWCFHKAGWKFAGVTRSGKIIWERVV